MTKTDQLEAAAERCSEGLDPIDAAICEIGFTAGANWRTEHPPAEWVRREDFEQLMTYAILFLPHTREGWDLMNPNNYDAKSLAWITRNQLEKILTELEARYPEVPK